MCALTYLPYLILRTAISAISATSCARGRGRERGHPYKHVYRHLPLTLTLYHSSVIGICPGFTIHWSQLSLKLTALFTNNNLSECMLLPTYPTALIIGEVTGLQHSPTSLRLIPIIIPFFGPTKKIETNSIWVIALVRTYLLSRKRKAFRRNNWRKKENVKRRKAFARR